MRWHDEWLLLPQRFALHEPSATAVLADVHLGYTAARQRLGDAIPSRSVAEELLPLLDAALLHPIRDVVIAGDLFERGYSVELASDFLSVLQQHHLHLQAIVPGNHDRGIDKADPPLPCHAAGFDLAGWHIVHGDQALDHPRLIAGHWHPAQRVGGAKRPCFLTRASQLILPAFSLDAAGADVSKDRRWRDWTRHAIK